MPYLERPGRFTPMFTSKVFIYLALSFRYVVNYELIFVHDERNDSNMRSWSSLKQSQILLSHTNKLNLDKVYIRNVEGDGLYHKNAKEYSNS